MSADSLDFFFDAAWGQVASHRLGTFQHMNVLPTGRLLGGSSKLAALAVARKKKEADRAAAEAPNNDRSIDLLDRLGKDRPSPADSSSQPKTMTFPTRQKKQTAPEPQKDPTPEKLPQPAPVKRDDLRAKPSNFAETLFGASTAQESGGVSLITDDTVMPDQEDASPSFKLPYMSDPDFVKRDPFVKPSPDDVVLRAQGRDS